LVKKDGDYVSEGEAVCEIESDKASMELPAPSAGVLKIIEKAGSELKIGAKIGELDTAGKAAAKPVAEQAVPAKKEEPKDCNSRPRLRIKEIQAASPAARKILEEKGS